LNISILAAGAGGMYCGSCMRDNALATALKRLGHHVTLIPLYTPLRTDAPAESIPEVYYGGVNVYLQHATRLFRHTPRVLDAIFDRPWLLNTAGSMGAQSNPEKLANFTLDVIQGEDGNAAKELSRLVEFLRDEVKPRVVSLPNLMFIGMARTFRQALGVPVVCELTGEDIFLDAMKPADRERIRAVIRSRARDVTRFVATSEYYAGVMAGYLGIPRNRIDVVCTGLAPEYLAQPPTPHGGGGPPTVGYLARICPEKGLARLVDAYILLRKLPGMERARLKIAGYLGAKDEKWFRALQKRVQEAGAHDGVEYLGEVDRDGKLAFLDSIDVFSVPTAYPEAKGIYVLEAMARGVPVVQPAHGSFPELIRATGGGLLVPPGDADALANSLAGLLRDPGRRAELGRRGRAAVESAFTDEHMAANMLEVYEAAMNDQSQHEAPRRGTPEPPVPSSMRISDPQPEAAGPALAVSGVWKEYPTPAEPLVVLRGVSLQMQRGETLAIVGPSGSGKSTLLNILGTLDRPTRGSVRLGEVDPFVLGAGELAHYRSGKIGFIFQDHHLLPQCTAAENVLIARLAAGRVSRADAARANELLNLVGLADRARHLPSELSGGERQRVAIARALMNRPELLLCDEPTGNLDQNNSHAVGELLIRLASETNAILITVTHSAALAEMFGRRMRMSDGVLTEGDAEPATSMASTPAPAHAFAPSPSGRGLG
jgi:ABC-type lipoprotein export system ATPase subunit/glycosyltransferase involved in cell wall biosynthesis